MSRLLLGVTILWCSPVLLQAADQFLTVDGQPRAEIVIAENPARSTRLAAHELQTYVEKISGAHLPIVFRPSGQYPVKVYVGRSSFTDQLKVNAQGLHAGAYRIVSGDDWIVFIGDDSDFTPIEPWARNNDWIVKGTTQKAWEQVAHAPWGAPNLLMYKNQLRLRGDLGLPAAATEAQKSAPLNLWCYDERGSFNAVVGYLEQLGVRWYLPGELGEIVPRLATIPLPKIDQTVTPDFALRRFSFRFSANDGQETALWSMRLGMRDPFDIQDAHGLDTMTNRDEIFAAHPNWFALYGGKRSYQSGNFNNHLCYSNEELIQATADYVRTQFDHYKTEMVSVMPPDGYTSMCQCPLCEGKDSSERHSRGLLSDYVWGFVNRVAKEVGRTHPDKKILNCAYGIYTLPPLKIAKLEPNVVVSIVGGRGPLTPKPDQQAQLRQLRADWAAKTDNPIIIFENYPFIDRGWYLPAYMPHLLGETINATKGMSHGEDISLTTQNFDKVGLGFNHFMVYFTAKMYWGGPQRDADQIFREYCRLFYGPAEEPMRVFFTYCETHWQDMEKDKTKADRALQLFAAAQQAAPAESVYSRRISLIDDFLKGLRSKSVQLGKKRGPVPQLRLVGEATSPIKIDGKLDEESWVKAPLASTVRLSELQTGRAPIFGTTVKSAWRGNDLYFGIRCEEHPGEKLNIGARKQDDSAIWFGDVVELLLETESRSYYQVAINPAATIADLDRSAARDAWFSWDSQAEVATQVADDQWTIEIRIPVTQDENDPLHQVIGRKPDTSLPWHINVCRQRVRGQVQELSAYSPTGLDHFHEVTKFAHFYDGNSYQFDAESPGTDYLDVLNRGTKFAQQGQYAEALAAYTAAATQEKVTDFQKSAALELAAQAARQLRQPAVAAVLAAQVPIEAVRKLVVMQNLLDQFQAGEVVKQFGDEDIENWPFWKKGAGYLARGRAYAIVKEGSQAEADLLRALEWTSDRRLQDTIRYTLGSNRQSQLKDDSGALKAYREIIDGAQQLDAADQFYAVQGAASILNQRGQFDEALTILRKVDVAKVGDFWRGSLLLTLGGTQQAAGRNSDALATYQKILADERLNANHRQSAREAVQKLPK